MRRARVLIHLAVLLLLPIAARANDDPVFDSPAMRVCFVDLLRKVGWGLAGPFERAAFVIEGADGSLSCDPWPSTHGYLTESFHGIVPEHAIAIVHTHPVRFPMPSQQDQDDQSGHGFAPVSVGRCGGQVEPPNSRDPVAVKQR